MPRQAELGKENIFSKLSNNLHTYDPILNNEKIGRFWVLSNKYSDYSLFVKHNISLGMVCNEKLKRHRGLTQTGCYISFEIL